MPPYYYDNRCRHPGPQGGLASLTRKTSRTPSLPGSSPGCASAGSDAGRGRPELNLLVHRTTRSLSSACSDPPDRCLAHSDPHRMCQPQGTVDMGSVTKIV